MEVKKATTYEEQIKILKSRGCEICNEEFAKNNLAAINYYRLTAYFLPFRTKDGTYFPETKFERIYNIYEFDRKLRNILLLAIEEIEVYLRAQLAYFIALKYGPLGYLEEKNFNQEKFNFAQFYGIISLEIEKNKDVPFVRHHIEKYENNFPIWVVCELFTFGNLSMLYRDLVVADQKVFAKQSFNAHYKELGSWLRCCTDLRNICAHYGRLYYRIFSAVPRNNKNLTEVEQRSLWGAIFAVKNLYPWAEKWNTSILTQLDALFNQYQDDIDLKHIAFPDNWRELLKK